MNDSKWLIAGLVGVLALAFLWANGWVWYSVFFMGMIERMGGSFFGPASDLWNPVDWFLPIIRGYDIWSSSREVAQFGRLGEAVSGLGNRGLMAGVVGQVIAVVICVVAYRKIRSILRD